MRVATRVCVSGGVWVWVWVWVCARLLRACSRAHMPAVAPLVCLLQKVTSVCCVCAHVCAAPFVILGVSSGSAQSALCQQQVLLISGLEAAESRVI